MTSLLIIFVDDSTGATDNVPRNKSQNKESTELVSEDNNESLDIATDNVPGNESQNKESTELALEDNNESLDIAIETEKSPKKETKKEKTKEKLELLLY